MCGHGSENYTCSACRVARYCRNSGSVSTASKAAQREEDEGDGGKSPMERANEIIAAAEKKAAREAEIKAAKEAMKLDKICATCQAENSKHNCSGCIVTCYCSKECQKKVCELIKTIVIKLRG